MDQWIRKIMVCFVGISALVFMCMAGAGINAKAAGEIPLKRVFDSNNPMYTLKLYEQDNVIEAWENVADNMKDNTVVWIVCNKIKNSNQQAKDFYISLADKIEEYNKTQTKKIYYIMQALNGETPATDHIDIKYWEQFTNSEKYPCMLGLNAAELYNSTPWAAADVQFNIGITSNDPDKYGNHGSYLADLIDLCGDTGMYFLWSDTNRSGAYGKSTDVPVINRWLENRKWVQNGTGAIGSYMTNAGRTYTSKYDSNSIKNDLKTTMKNNYKNVILINKESFGHPATDSLFYGLWLAGYCGNWGTSSDWWHWGIHFNTGESQTWRNITRYVDSMTAQSIVRVANHGGTVFNNEAGWFTTAITNPDTAVDAPNNDAARIATFQYTVLPLLQRLKSGEIDIPEKSECINDTKLLCIGADSWRGIYMNDGTGHNRENGDIFPKEGRYGLTPILPANIEPEILTDFTAKLPNGSKVIAKKNNITQNITSLVQETPANDALYTDLLNSLYAKEYTSSNTYINRTGKTWWWYGWNENGADYQTVFEPKEVQANWMDIRAGQYIYGIFKEKPEENKISVYLNNYRIDKSALNNFTSDMGGAPSPAENWWYDTAKYPWGESGAAYNPQMRTRKWIYDNLSVKLSDGYPVIVGDGSLARVKTASNYDLKDTRLYSSTIKIKGTYMGAQPQVQFKNSNSQYSRYYTTNEVWDSENQILTITMNHNGQVDFDILVDAKSQISEPAANVAFGKTVTTSGTYTSQGEGIRQIAWITDGDKTAEKYIDIHSSTGDKTQLQWIQIDLGQKFAIDSINLWRYFTDGRTYPVTIAMISNDPDFSTENGTSILFNSCKDPGNQTWTGDTPAWIRGKAGSDTAYSETSAGKNFKATGSYQGRYVRIYSKTNSPNSGDNHFVEAEVMGK